METGKIAGQIIGFHKAVFNNTFNGMVVSQEYLENMAEGFLKQFPWINEDNKKPINESVSFIKKARDEYKKAVDQGFVKLEELTEKR